MLEESKMDKKSSNRSSQPQSRPSAIDCKKSELTHKPWPRNKKREGTGTAPKNEPHRKNVPTQRGRGQVDRRPRARGPPTFNVGGTQNTGIGDDDEPEIGSVFVPGSKKQNLNHLLNFMYPTRGGGPEHRGPAPRRNMVHRVSHRLEHDLYLRANCQFVVKEDGNYKANLLDPDVPLKWDHVEEIVVRSTGRSECPICLGTPAAGRVSLCGHVYCWACVLHYVATHEKQSPPCPVCAAPLQVKDMKPTRMVQWEPPSEEVTMRLVRRLRGSTTVEVAPPRGQYKDTQPESLLPLEDLDKAPYAKYFTATKQQVQDILERERKEIHNQILAEIDTTEIVFLEEALGLLKLQEDKVNAQFTECKVQKPSPDHTELDAPTIYEKQEVNEHKVDWFDVTDEGEACVQSVQEQMDELKISETVSELNPDAPCYVQSDVLEECQFPQVEDSAMCDTEESENCTGVTDIDKQNQAKYFYFYQAEDGQQVFLNNINVKFLNASWGVLAAAPPVIRGRVLQRETMSLEEQTRKHLPYTAHLPLYCSFDIVELDLKEPFVTASAIESFQAELDRRARMRSRAAREERRRERAARRAAEPPPRPDVFSAELFPPAPAPAPPPAASDAPCSSSGPSFAKMASSSGAWRVRAAPAPAPPAPADEGEAVGPRALSLSDAIEAALHAPATNKKNKKSKQKVLFATGMHRAA